MKNFLKPISTLVQRYTSPQSSLNEVIKKTPDKRYSHKLKRNRQFKVNMQIDAWEKANALAEDQERPRRYLLLSMIRQAMKDPHLISQVNNRLEKFAGEPYAWFDEGTDTIDDELTKLFQRPWFYEYMKLYASTPFYGHNLVEFQEMVPSKSKLVQQEFKSIKLFPREHVCPEKGLILIDYIMDDTGIPFREEPFNTWLMEMGRADDLGLLNSAVREIIYKYYSRSDWSRHSEKFGMPILAMGIGSMDNTEIDKAEEMASNFGNNLYILHDDLEQVKLLEQKNSDAYKIYLEQLKYSDEQNSKLATGSSSIGDQKSFVGSAKVHDKQFGEISESDLRRATFHVNFDLAEFLQKHGYPLEGKEYRYLRFMKEEDDAENGKAPKHEEEDEKALSGKKSLPGWY